MKLSYTLGGVVLKVEIEEKEQLEMGNTIAVTPFYNGRKGRKCNKAVHSEEDKTKAYIWWNGQKVFLEEHDILSSEEVVEKWKAASLEYDELVTALYKNKDIAVAIMTANLERVLRIERVLWDEPSLCNMVSEQEDTYIDRLSIDGTPCCLRPMRVGNRAVKSGWVRNISLSVRNMNGCPIIVNKPLGEYKKKYLYVDDNFHLQESDKFPLKYLFRPFPKGLKDGGIVDKPKRFNYYI